jgi:hypothetical protein
LPNRRKSKNALAERRSISTNNAPNTSVAAISPSTAGLPQPSVLPWVTSTCSASIATMKASTPGRSNL